MALEDELCPENVQELLKLLSCIKNNTNEAQVESCMSLLAEGLDEEEDVDRLETERAHCTVQSAMRDYKTSYKNSTTRLLCALQTPGALVRKTRSDALDNGAVGAVLYAMSHFGEDEEFLYSGVRSFNAITVRRSVGAGELYKRGEKIHEKISYGGGNHGETREI
ncbi:hypothetical protein OS493_039046, partial [Desmophyllum pertusum]